MALVSYPFASLAISHLHPDPFESLLNHQFWQLGKLQFYVQMMHPA
jgi:hypothetical protein